MIEKGVVLGVVDFALALYITSLWFACCVYLSSFLLFFPLAPSFSRPCFPFLSPYFSLSSPLLTPPPPPPPPPLEGVLCWLTESPHPPPPPSTVLSLKEGLINCRQHEAFIRTLMVTNLAANLREEANSKRKLKKGNHTNPLIMGGGIKYPRKFYPPPPKYPPPPSSGYNKSEVEKREPHQPLDYGGGIKYPRKFYPPPPPPQVVGTIKVKLKKGNHTNPLIMGGDKIS